MNLRYATDRNGAPVLLAPVSSASVEPGDAEKKEATQRLMASVDRRRDGVVEAARTIDDLSPAGVEKLVRQRWRGDRALTPEDVQSFSAAARAQRVHDVVDALDFRIRRAVYGRANSKRTHVSIPRGIVGKSLASLDPQEQASVMSRLRDLGWTNQQISRHGVRRFDKDGAMRKLLADPKA